MIIKDSLSQIDSLTKITSIVNNKFSIGSDSLFIDSQSIQKLTNSIESLNERLTDWTPYIIFFGGIGVAILAKKYYTYIEFKRLEKIFYLWNENLLKKLKKQSDNFSEYSNSMRDIDGMSEQLKLYGIKIATETILEVKSDKYFHLFITNRICNKKLTNLFYRTINTYNSLIDNENLHMKFRDEHRDTFEKAITSWNENYKYFVEVINTVLTQEKEQPSTDNFKVVLTPHLKIMDELQSKSLKERRQIKKVDLMNLIRNMESDILKLKRTKTTELILKACDQMGFSEKLMVNAYQLSEEYYSRLSQKYMDIYNRLELYMKLWKRTRSFPFLFVRFYKPLDF